MGKMFLEVCAVEEGFDWFFNPLAWLTGLSVAFTVFSNLYNLNFTIGMFNQLQVMPTYECSIILGTLVSGGIIMNEFVLYELRQLLLIFMGSCIAIVGIMYKLCVLEASEDPEDEEIIAKAPASEEDLDNSSEKNEITIKIRQMKS